MLRHNFLALVLVLSACGGGETTDAGPDARPDAAGDAAGDALGDTAGDAQACAPGSSTTCDCTAGMVGIKYCNADGNSYSPCMCEGPADAGGDTGSDVGSDAPTGSDSGATDAGPVDVASGSDASGLRCVDLSGQQPDTAHWDATLAAASFASTTSYDAYAALNDCACVRTTSDPAGGCADVCSSTAGGGRSNFCQGNSVSMQCKSCLLTACANQYAACVNH